MSNPTQEWFSDLANADNRCPDAWCKKCEQKFQRSGCWTDENSKDCNISLICQHCYENIRAESVPHCMTKVADTWDTFLSECVGRLHQKQKTLNTLYKINDHKRWDWNQGSGLLVFSNNGRPAVNASIQFVGSISTLSNTWLWAWANQSYVPGLREGVLDVQTYGDKSEFVNLTVPLWAADEADGWEMTAVAVELLGAKGAYRTPSEDGFTYIAIMDIDWVT